MRPKQPYRAPESQAFTGPGAPASILGHLSRTKIAAAGYFDPVLVERLVKNAGASLRPGSETTWLLLGFCSTQLWHCAFTQTARADGTALASQTPDTWRKEPLRSLAG